MLTEPRVQTCLLHDVVQDSDVICVQVTAAVGEAQATHGVAKSVQQFELRRCHRSRWHKERPVKQPSAGGGRIPQVVAAAHHIEAVGELLNEHQATWGGIAGRDVTHGLMLPP